MTLSSNDSHHPVSSEPTGLPRLDESYQHLKSISPEAAEAFSEQLGHLQQRLTPEQLEAFFATGLQLATAEHETSAGAQSNSDGKKLTSYFRLESATASDRLAELETQMSLDEVRRLLELYSMGR